MCMPRLLSLRRLQRALFICRRVSSLVTGDLGWLCRAKLYLLLDIQLLGISSYHIGLLSGRRLFQVLVWLRHVSFASVRRMWLRRGCRKVPGVWHLGFGAWEDIGVMAIVDLEGTFSHGGVHAVVVSECDEG